MLIDHIVTADYIGDSSALSLYNSPNGALVLAALDDDTTDWLKRTEMSI